MCDASHVQALEREALRLNDRYLTEVIEPHKFCPYARAARLNSRMRRYVITTSHEDRAQVLDLMAEVADDPTQEVVQVIFPTVELDASAWRDATRSFDEGLVKEHGEGYANVLASAAFHPDLSFSTRSPATLVPLFRRAPDPTIQWTRLDVLDALHSSQGGRSSHFLDVRGLSVDEIMAALASFRPSLSERIAEANLRTAESLGVDHVVNALADIATERATVYAKIRAGQFEP